MDERSEAREDWTRPKPAETAQPTYWPMVLAAGIVTFAWGLVFSPWFVALGAGLFVVALAGWIVALRQE